MTSLALAVTASFYAWETRGRGWQTADEPVMLEPPYRPCFLLPEHLAAHDTSHRAPLDDGKRPTFLSSLVEAIRALATPAQSVEAPPPFIEADPFPQGEVPALTTLRLHVPEGEGLTPDSMEQLLGVIGSALHPVAFELIGTEHRVHLELAVSSFDAPRLAAQIEAFAPWVTVLPGADALQSAWREDASTALVSFGLADEFFLPLPGSDAFPVDPYAPLIPALAEAGPGECLVFQVLFSATRNPWIAAIRDALDDGEGGCVFEDAPWLLRAAKEKTETPLSAVVVRALGMGATRSRAKTLLRGTHAFFAQFERAQGNTLVPLALHDEPADVLARVSRRTGMLLSRAELGALVHLPTDTVRHAGLLRGDTRNVPLPPSARGHDLVLGTHTHRGTSTTASVDAESRFAHTWVIGGSGTGKSTLLANLILADIRAGHSVAVVEPHGDLIDDVLARIPPERQGDVVVFDPADPTHTVPLTVFDARSQLEETLLASDLVAIMRRLSTSWGDAMTTVLGQAVVAMLRLPEGASLRDLKRFLSDADARRSMLAVIDDPDVRHFWETEYPLIGSRSIGPLLTRLDTFLRMPLMRDTLGARRSAFHLGDCLDSGKIVLARLAKGQIGEENAYLLGSLFFAKIATSALMRQAVPQRDRRPAFIYVDECQHFVTPSVESLVTEGRKYRVGLTLAHQTLAQLDQERRMEGALFGNCHTRIVFRVGDEDAHTLAKGFARFEPDALRSLGRGEAIVRLGDAGSDFRIDTVPLPPLDDTERADATLRVRALSRERYAVERTTLAPTHRSAIPRAADPAPAAPQEKAAAPPPRRAAPNERPAPPLTGRGGQMHKYLQHLVKRLAEERGFRATIEGAAGPGQADVCLVRGEIAVACEISVTTDAPHEIANLRKCIAAGFAHVLVISPERTTRDALRVAMGEMTGATVSVIAPEEIVTALDALGAPPALTETVVRGYKVKVTRQSLSPEELAERRSVMARVVAGSGKSR